jgi:hypothetical protein
MPTLRRILKYTPAVVMGLLIVAWGVSLCVRVGFALDIASAHVSCGVGHATLSFGAHELDPGQPPEWAAYPAVPSLGARYVLGSAILHTSLPGRQWLYGLNLPIPLLITATLPLAIGPFLSFRFRLWHYLAYTALVALELAYYLRWQE